MKKLILLPLLLLLIFSCKKKEADPPEEPPVITPEPVGTHSGVFSAEKLIFWTGGMPMSHTFRVRVFLFSTPKAESAIYTQGENLGLVKSNDYPLEYNTSLRYYHMPSTSLSYSAQVSFQHTSTPLGAINYVSTDTFPSITPAFAAQIEDTLNKTKNYVIPLTGISYYSHATCTLYDGNLLATGVTKTVLPGATGFTFTPAEMTSLKLGQQNFVRILLAKQNEQTINGKLFRFENVTYSDFNIVVK